MAANKIAEHIFAQVDDDGHRELLFDESVIYKAMLQLRRERNKYVRRRRQLALSVAAATAEATKDVGYLLDGMTAPNPGRG